MDQSVVQGRATRARVGAAVLATGLLALGAGAAAADRGPGTLAVVPPQPCAEPQIEDALGDGHHHGTDVLSAWLSEENGGALQAVIEVREGRWTPEHDEPGTEIVAGYAFLFETGGETRYVRLSVDQDENNTFDYGTWTLAGGFVTQGATTGVPDPVTSLAGTVTIDVPTTLADDGDLLTPFVLTYDGIVGGVPTPVDQAPGGTEPNDPTRGADYVVGACIAVGLHAPKKLTGAKTVTLSGQVLPEEEGLDVTVTREAQGTAVSHVTTDADGRYELTVRIRERTRVTAEANDISSQTRTVAVKSKVTISKQRRRNGGWKIKGRTDPALPGRVLLFKDNAIRPKATKEIGGGGFAFTFGTLKPARYQVLYVPKQGRAERSTSNKVQIR